MKRLTEKSVCERWASRPLIKFFRRNFAFLSSAFFFLLLSLWPCIIVSELVPWDFQKQLKQNHEHSFRRIISLMESLSVCFVWFMIPRSHKMHSYHPNVDCSCDVMFYMLGLEISSSPKMGEPRIGKLLLDAHHLRRKPLKTANKLATSMFSVIAKLIDSALLLRRLPNQAELWELPARLTKILSPRNSNICSSRSFSRVTWTFDLKLIESEKNFPAADGSSMESSQHLTFFPSQVPLSSIKDLGFLFRLS